MVGLVLLAYVVEVGGVEDVAAFEGVEPVFDAGGFGHGAGVV